MVNARRRETSSASGLLLFSQSSQPEKLFNTLITTAVKESWILLLVHFHTAIFFGLILLASGYDEISSLIYLGIHLLASLTSSMVIVYLIRRSSDQLVEKRAQTVWGLMATELLISGGWGSSFLIYFFTSDYDQASILVVLLLAAGISSAALSAKLLRVLLVGRVLVFLPSFAYLIWYQPPDWIYHSGSLVLSFGIAIAVGYAIHVQLLREASLTVDLAESQAQVVAEAEFREYFLKSITHDLRQPISSLSLHYRHLKRRNPSLVDSARATSIESCLDSANQIMDNVAQLAWVSDRLPDAEFELVELNILLRKTVSSVRPLAEQKGLRLDYVETSLFCMTDENYLQRILRNLLQNAIEYTDVGRILVGVRNLKSTGKLEIKVIDTGCGIDRANWGTIFDRYQRVDYQSGGALGHLGLGLAIVENIAAELDAEITLSSAVGLGTSFGVQLDQVLPKPSRTMPCSTQTVLIVDDDVSYADFLQSVAQSAGFESRVVCDSREIEALFEVGLPEADCYLVDYHLGDNQDGLMLLAMVPKTATRLLISSFDTPQIRNKVKQAGVSMIVKSQNNEVTKQALARYMTPL